MFVTLSSAMTFVQAGRLKALGVTTPRRLEGLPLVPTMIEAGYPGMVSGSWQGMFTPAGTPRAIVEKLHAALLDTFPAPEIHQRFPVGGAQVITSNPPAQYPSFMAAHTHRC